MSSKNTGIKKQLALAGVIFAVGLFVGLLIADKLFHPGCKLSFKFSPPSIDSDCASAPFETTINYGSNPSERPLESALKILAERTQDKESARIYINPDVLESNFASNKVHPPSGPQGTIGVLRQLLADAGALERVDICVIPSGGMRVQLRR